MILLILLSLLSSAIGAPLASTGDVQGTSPVSDPQGTWRWFYEINVTDYHQGDCTGNHTTRVYSIDVCPQNNTNAMECCKYGESLYPVSFDTCVWRTGLIWSCNATLQLLDPPVDNNQFFLSHLVIGLAFGAVIMALMIVILFVHSRKKRFEYETING
jgi:hypothetical protein